MKNILVGGALAFAVGGILSFFTYLITKKLLKKGDTYLSATTMLRQVVSIGYLVALFFLSRVLPWPMEALLIGGALGVTITSVLLALRMAAELKRKEN